MKFRYPVLVLAAMTVAACSDAPKSPTGIAAIKAPEGKLWIGNLTEPTASVEIVGSFVAATGWYNSDVTATWTITDPDGLVTSATGCDPISITTDMDYSSFCVIESVFGQHLYEVVIPRDATSPVLTIAGNGATYDVDQVVNITCTATDATSGLTSPDCGSKTGDAYTYGLGEHMFIANATDRAGNGMVDYIRFNVVVTADGLCNLAKRWFDPAGQANGLCSQLKNGSYDQFRKQVTARIGKSISAANGAKLIELSNSL